MRKGAAIGQVEKWLGQTAEPLAFAPVFITVANAVVVPLTWTDLL
jgi:hypothetical protein